MHAIDRWRNWSPKNENIAGNPKRELTKPTKPTSVSFVSSLPGYLPNISSGSGGMSDHDAQHWMEDFNVWLRESCSHRDGYDDWGGVGALHVDFCEWAVNHESVPCMRQTFETLLRDAGYLIANGMVSGVVLKADLWAVAQRAN